MKNEISTHTDEDANSGKCGCVAAIFAGSATLLPLLFLTFFEGCPSNYPCHEGEWLRGVFLLFVSAGIAALVGLMVKWLIDSR